MAIGERTTQLVIVDDPLTQTQPDNQTDGRWPSPDWLTQTDSWANDRQTVVKDSWTAIELNWTKAQWKMTKARRMDSQPIEESDPINDRLMDDNDPIDEEKRRPLSQLWNQLSRKADRTLMTKMTQTQTDGQTMVWRKTDGLLDDGKARPGLTPMKPSGPIINGHDGQWRN